MLTVAICLAGFWYAIGGPHIYKNAMRHCKEMEKKNHSVPTWTKEFEAFEIKRGTPLPIRRELVHLWSIPSSFRSYRSLRIASFFKFNFNSTKMYSRSS